MRYVPNTASILCNPSGAPRARSCSPAGTCASRGVIRINRPPRRTRRSERRRMIGTAVPAPSSITACGFSAFARNRSKRCDFRYLPIRHGGILSRIRSRYRTYLLISRDNAGKFRISETSRRNAPIPDQRRRPSTRSSSRNRLMKSRYSRRAPSMAALCRSSPLAKPPMARTLSF